MSLTLTLALDQTRSLYAESILTEVKLTNGGSDPMELPLLGMNEGALSFVLQSSQGEKVGEYTWADALRRLQQPKVTGDKATLDVLEPGATDLLRRDFLMLREPIDPGSYRLKARFCWKDHDVESEAVPFEVTPSSAHSAVVGGDGDAAGPFHLGLAWIDTIDAAPWLVSGMTFGVDHKMMHHVLRVAPLAAPLAQESMALAQGTGPQASHEMSLLWIAEGKLRAAEVGAGAKTEVAEWPLPAAHLRFATRPLRFGSVVYALLSDGGESARFMELELGVAPQISDPSKEPITVPATAPCTLVQTSKGEVDLVVAKADAGGSAVTRQRLWPAIGTPREIFRARTETLALATIQGPGAAPAVGFLVHGDEAHTAHGYVLTGDELAADTTREADFTLGETTDLQLALDTEWTLHVLCRRRGEKGATYLSSDGVESVPMRLEELDENVKPLFVPGRSGRLFTVTAAPKTGCVLHPMVAAPAAGVGGSGMEGCC